MDDFAYVIDTFTATLAVDVRLNDWPVYHALDGVGRVARQKVNPWLLEGENRVQVRLQPLDDEAVAALASAKEGGGLPPGFTLTFYKTEHGTSSCEEDILLYFDWTASEYPLQKDSMTQVLDHTIPFVKAFGPWTWERARPFMPADRPAVEALVAAFHGALERRDVPGLVSLLRVKLEEMARSLNQDPAQMLVKQQNYFEQFYFNDPSFRVDPLDTSQLVLESSAGGRLVAVRGPGGRAPLTGSAGPRPFDFSLTVSAVDNGWSIVR